MKITVGKRMQQRHVRPGQEHGAGQQHQVATQPTQHINNNYINNKTNINGNQSA